MDRGMTMIEQALEARFGRRNPKHPIHQARQARKKFIHDRPPWPYSEPDPWAEDTEGKTEPDTCPPWTYPASMPGPPPRYGQKPTVPLPPAEQNKIETMSQHVGREAATYILNPYIFSTPFSQDFDIFGQRVVDAISARFLITRFQIPPGNLGIYNAVGVEIEPALQSFTSVSPEINDATMKDFSTIIVTGYSTPVLTSGVNYCMGTLCKPRKLFHPVTEEGSLGLSVIVTAGGGPLLPTTVSANARGRYWPPTVATQFWNYVKG